MTALAASHTDYSVPPLLGLCFLVVLGGMYAAGMAIVIVRIMRGREPREQQMARLAAQLDGRSKVTVRMVELRLPQADLFWVAHSRGYGVIEHQFGKYYEFVYAPHRIPPAWQGRPWTTNS